MKKKKIIIIAIIIIIVIFVAISIVNILNSENTTSEVGVNGPVDGLSIEIGTIDAEDIVNTISADGQVDMVEKSVVYSPSTGQVSVVNFQVGDTVKKGDVLLSYDEDTLENLKEELELAKLDLKSGQLALDSITIPAGEDQLLQLEAQLRTNEVTIENANKQVEQIDLQINNNNQQLAQAKVDLSNGELLYTNGIISQSDLDALRTSVSNIENTLKGIKLDRENATSSINVAKSTYEDTKAQINLLKNKNSTATVQNQVNLQEVSIEKLNIRVEELERDINEFKKDVLSEQDGVILTRAVEIGTAVQTGSTLFTIGSTERDNLVAKVNVLEYDSGSIEIGQEAVITGDSLGDNEVTGTISKIYPTIEEKIINSKAKKVVVVEIRINDSDLSIKSGSTIEAEITTSTDEGQTVAPLMSITTDDEGNNCVFVIKEDFSVERRLIDIGEYTGTNVGINNVSVGENVVMNPPVLLKDGDFVKYASPVIE